MWLMLSRRTVTYIPQQYNSKHQNFADKLSYQTHTTGLHVGQDTEEVLSKVALNLDLPA